MRVLFITRHPGYIRNFESTLRLLAERGHQIHLGFQASTEHGLLDPTQAIQRLCDEWPGLSYGPAPTREEDRWATIASDLRLGIDYLRYLDPIYKDAPKLRLRLERRAPAAVRRVATSRGFGSAPGRGILNSALRAFERALPESKEITDYVRAQRPDLVLVTPLVEPGAPQGDYVRAARALGIRTGLCVASWDNLTNKGIIQHRPDFVAVWNDPMKKEAVELHGLQASRVVVTGAQPYDHWFEWQPSRSREQFCATVGLSADRPIILYLCSSKFIAPREAPFVEQWARRIREHPDPLLATAGILVRPHPQNAKQWEHHELSDIDNLAIWPERGANPFDDQSRADYFDSIYHCAAVMGVNTSAQIESAVIGRPVHTWKTPEFRDTQEGTLHFHHLTSVNGGLLRVAESFEQHAEQVRASLAAAGQPDERSRRFVAAFVRPFGLTEAATPRLVAAIEEAARQPAPAPRRRSLTSFVLQRLLLRYLDSSRSPERARLADPGTHARKDQKGKRARRAGLSDGNPAERKAKAGADEGALASTTNGVAGADASPTAGVPNRLPLAVKRFARAFHALPDDTQHLVLHELLPANVRSFLNSADALAGDKRRLEYGGALIYLLADSPREKMRLRACKKEPWTVAWIEQWVEPTDVFYDIGANVGPYSLVAAKKSGARVVSFEPGFTSFASLCKNIALNAMSDRITPLQVAVSDRTGMDIFNYGDLQPGAANHSFGGVEPTLQTKKLGVGAGPVTSVPFRQPVMTFRLDDLIEFFGLEQPNHVKIDVDGTEIDVLRGATKTLSSPSLKSVLIEVTVDQSDAVTAVLGEIGLQLRTKFDVQSKSGEQRIWYGVFAPATASPRPLVVSEKAHRLVAAGES